MMKFGSPSSDTGDDIWKARLDRFVLENAKELAVLAWGFHLERGDSDEILGIDLKPTPHFISFSRSAIERLNRNVSNQLQEILGILDGHNPEKEVLYIAIGNGQLKLLNFAPEPPPPACFEESDRDLTELADDLEARLSEIFSESKSQA
ncbi:hypothetical protein [Oscillatoria sp. FACHB-1406]|uniref:beta-carboxysome assembly chaperone CcmS n=1 Tax=Oscillatoria sp. FACHB-1406 TaxID=2692846 RepID=UPI00168345DA|nr:hypothetical protein [Oscillatoria sp. FACHB-1406]MBD2577032.1 hypothetical protein [Oscillatoria sp. FACHB-1406]